MNRVKQMGIGFLAVLLSMGLVSAGAEEKKHKQIGQYSGFEGNEEVLGAAVAAAIRETGTADDPRYVLEDQELQIGLAVSKMIKTFNSSSAYQHEMNDALVKMTLEYIQFAKNQDRMEAIARQDAMTQFPMLTRVAKMIDETGNAELGLLAITDQTACFFQLAGQVQRAPGMITYRAPYGHVLTQTRRMGMHDLTEQEIHDRWTKPHIEVWSDVLGIDIQITDWQEDGMITISIPEIAEAVAKNVIH
ncbi:MAG: hypothetical protein QF483_04520 [Gammaproteobacteria bacterium]|jgi:hypothetical protein|nr:hypothetical protein [Chromatiales bacterium]MDP6150761.1 hypothetical protein [Gammaproteobacteria bacterium]MDP7270775.1 hypothetical protein [Gammaproteobacteria bacterium]MDP7419123.1 hypothetical protein [Gammaproteobacteria bacterium]HJP03914.1 hypothetical protein [Gammaproteobacteria bacterium]